MIWGARDVLDEKLEIAFTSLFTLGATAWQLQV